MKRLRILAVVSILGILLSGCATSPTFLNPNSSVSAKESSLYWIVLYMAAGVFLLVWGILIYNIIRYRRRRGQPDTPRQKYGNWRLEVTWTAIPTLLVLILFVMTITTLNATAAPRSEATDVNVHVIGHQWWWEFDYPDLGIVTANELHVPAGANVHLTMDSVDVIHSFWVPQLSGKLDVIPGQTNHLWFRANQVGDFGGQCAEFCGLNHANMRILVRVQNEGEYAAWVTSQQAPVYQASGEQEQAGFKIVTTGICSNCHTLGDNQAKNPIGPNLTHLMSRSVFAGATYPLTEENLRNWLGHNQEMKPGNDMKVNLSDKDIESLMAFLLKLK